MTMTAAAVPRAFIWRRLHSLMGLWLVLFLLEHLLTNSQAALWLGDNGKGFVAMVNGLHNLPYLQVVELVLLGFPIALHMVLGVKYLFTSKAIPKKTDGSAPAIHTCRNRAYRWQRISSWILLFLLIGHVVKFRFLDYPDSVRVGTQTSYLMPVNVDDGIYTLAGRLQFSIYDADAIAKAKAAVVSRNSEEALLEVAGSLPSQTFDPVLGVAPEAYNSQKAILLNAAQQYREEVNWVNALELQKIGPNQVLAVCKDFGTATLLSVRDTFKSPMYVGIYTLFVLAACFHAFNGLWTFLITWGWILKQSAQNRWIALTFGLMLVILFLGLASIWGTYWMNLRT